MMKHDVEEQLEELERHGISRRHFLKILTAAGVITAAGTQQVHAFSSNAKGKIVVIGGGAAGISMAARLEETRGLYSQRSKMDQRLCCCGRSGDEPGNN